MCALLIASAAARGATRTGAQCAPRGATYAATHGSSRSATRARGMAKPLKLACSAGCGATMRIWLAVLHLLWGASSFAPPPARRAALARPAVPLAELPLREPLPALPAGHAFGVATRGDVVELVDLLMECFEDDVKVTLARELTPAERQMLEVPVGMWNLYTQLFARWEVDQGLRSRCGATCRRATASA